MQRYPELVICGDGDHGDRAIAIGTRQLSLGRGPDNDVVIPDLEISRHHALVWRRGDDVFLRDLGSANGTFINEVRVHDRAPLPYGATVRLGKNVQLQLRSPATPDRSLALRALALEDLASGLRRPLHTDRFVIGSGAGVDLRLDTGPDVAATLLVLPSGEVWLGEQDDDHALVIGQEFVVAGSRFRVLDVDPSLLPTVQPEANRYQYAIKVGLDGPGGAMAQITHLQKKLKHTVTAENRVVLMYLLARKIAADRVDKLPPSDQGWCSDGDVIVGVWGRSALESGGNRLKVLVHRVRKELKADGFEPWCIEKRSGLIRGHFAQVEVS